MNRAAATKPESAPICPYCEKTAVLVDSAIIYHSGRIYGMVWLCNPCQAWVGVHKGTNKPLGRLANKELRQWKIKAHAAFDPLWQAKYEQRKVEGSTGKSGRPGGPHYKKVYARMSGYKWLAEQMGIERHACHIGMFDVAMCKRVVEICSKFNPQPKGKPQCQPEMQY